jgi:hypothetical protein
LPGAIGPAPGSYSHSTCTRLRHAGCPCHDDRSSAEADARRRSQRVTQRHPDAVDEMNSDYSINGACQSKGRAETRHPIRESAEKIDRRRRGDC